jgi:hypothetical protein
MHGDGARPKLMNPHDVIGRYGTITRTVVVDRFQPFGSRRDTVMKLTFPYDPNTVALLKQTFAAEKSAVFNPEQHILAAGGWYPPEKSWWCEPAVWPVLKPKLESIGYRITARSS